jgi:soluble lytic murein transglycosylase-like protein
MKKVKTLTIIILGFIIGLLHLEMQKQTEPIESLSLLDSAQAIGIPRNAACIQMFESIEKWAAYYNIPKRYAYGIAYQETRYEGPFHWQYVHDRVSSVGAVGPMQIMPATGKMLDPSANRGKLLSDIDYNVELSMKLLRRLYDKHKNWEIVFGCYNTGRPLINQYAKSVASHQIQWSL